MTTSTIPRLEPLWAASDSALDGWVLDLPGWYAEAACRDEDADAYFPGLGMNYPARLVDLCRGCPVRVECLDLALELEEGVPPSGLFAGLTPNQRRHVRPLSHP